MQERKLYLSQMTWPEIQKCTQEKPCVLVPVGANECQNLHNPTGLDTLLATAFSEETAKRTGAVVAPVLPIGYSEGHMGFPGVITLKRETYIKVIYEVLDSLIQSGFDHFFFINGHSVNEPYIKSAVGEIRKKYYYCCPCINPASLAKDIAMKEQLFGENTKSYLSHGSECSSSLCAYLYPTLQRRDAIRDSGLEPPVHAPLDMEGQFSLSCGGYNIRLLGLRMIDSAPNGGFGRPIADPEKGKYLFEKVSGILAEFTENFQKMDPIYPILRK